MLEFEKYADEGNHFVNEVTGLLEWERPKAARITQAVLHALRDRVHVNEAIHFAQGLPMALKGVFIDQYEPGRVPVVIRDKDDFLDFIWNKLSNKEEIKERDEIAQGFRAVYIALGMRLDRGQLSRLENSLPHEILEIIRGQASA